MSFRKLYGLFMKSFALSCTVFALQFTACSSSPTVTVPTDSITAAVSPSDAVQPTGASSLSPSETPNVDTHPSPTPEGISKKENIEELVNAGKIIRPAYKYVGQHREYVNLEDRK